MRHVFRMPFVVFVSVLWAGTALGQGKDPTGPDWKEWSRKEKVMYLLGWVDGRQSGAWDAVHELRPDLTKRWSKDQKAPEPLSKVFSTVTVGQLLEGLDQFYSDYRNLHVEIRSAVELILGDATGRRPLTEEYLIQIRKQSAKHLPPE